MATQTDPERYLLSVVKAHMKTDFQLEVVVNDTTLGIGDSVLTEAHQLIRMIEDEITEFREISPVWELNHADVLEWIETPPHLLEMLKISEKLMKESGGLFNIFVKSKSAVTFQDLEIDPVGKRFRKRNADLHLGFGAIGKGYALDAVRPLFDLNGLSHYRLSCGGSSWVFSGLDPNLRAWKLGWAWRKDEDGDLVGRSFEIPHGEPVAIGVSGTLEQGNHFLVDGKPLKNIIQSSFYAGRSAAEADALSTALLVGAGLRGENILAEFENILRNPAIAYVDLEEQIIYNLSFNDRFLKE